jgi:transposase
MKRGRRLAELSLSVQETNQLGEWMRRHKTAQALALRSRIVLACAQDLANGEVAQRLQVTPQTVSKWRRRFVEKRLDGLLDEPRPGAPRTIGDARIERLVATTLNQLPQGATHWSTRSMATKLGLSQSTVSRVWRAFGLQPHRTETFKLSSDPLFIEKVRDIVGLYLDPPLKAMVLCVDEKSQIQALDRTQPGLPLKKGRASTMTHDYKRHGTTTLFAALDVKSGLVIGECQPRHRAKEFIRFLKRIDRCVQKHLDIHLVVDNYGTHKTPQVKAWLAKHRRFKLHFTPTSASWLNLVERFFAEITTKRIRRGIFRSVAELEETIHDYLDRHNANPKPFVWTKSAEVILEKERRALDVLDAIKAGNQPLDLQH